MSIPSVRVSFFVCFLAYVLASATNLFAQGCLTLDACNPSDLNGILFVDGVRHKSLAAAIARCPQTCWIIDNLPEQFSNDPFTGIGSKSVKVTLGRGTWLTSAPITIPTKSQLEGSGRGDPGFSGTVIQAAASFPTNAAVIEMGNAATSMGVRIENLTIDCNNIAGCIGLQNIRSQEQSGARHLLIQNITGVGLDVEGSAAQNSGPFEDLEFSGGTDFNVTPYSLCARVINVPAFRGIHGATCNFNNYEVHPVIGIQMDSTGTLNDVHIEGTNIGIAVGVSALGTGAMLQNIYGGGPNIHTLVHVFSGREILLTGLMRSTTPVLLSHNGHNVHDASLGAYVVHNAGRPPGSGLFSYLANRASVGTSAPATPQRATEAVVAEAFAAFVESPQRMNLVSGTATFNADGEVEVTLPGGFVSSSHEYRYQLTPVGGSANLYVAREIQNGSFRIAGGKAGLRVSWQVTAIQRETDSDPDRPAADGST